MQPISAAPFAYRQPALLAQLLCHPVSMLPAHLATLAGALQQGTPPRSLSENRSLSTSEDPATAPVMPWDLPLYSVTSGVALLDVCGPLVKGFDDLTCWAWGLASIDRLQASVADLATRDDVAVCIVKINSPGGVCTGLAELCDGIMALDAVKPTFAFTSDMACSAGYRIAAACRAFFTTPSAISGSIGTYIALYDLTEMLSAQGIKLELFAAGDYKAMGLEGNPLTAQQRAFLQAEVARANERFTSFVRARRGPIDDSTMQGQWFDGEQAVALGLANGAVASLPAMLAEVHSALSTALDSLAVAPA